MNMNDGKFNRRMFLKGTGGITLYLPLLPSLLPRAAEAQSVPQKKRFIAMFQPNSPTWTKWNTMAPATDLIGTNVRQRSLTASTANVSQILGSEFNPFKSKMLLLRGFDHMDVTGHTTAQFLAAGCNGTAGFDEKGSVSVTIDQVLRASPKIYSSEPALRSLHLTGCSDSLSLSYAKQGTSIVQVPQIANPQIAFDLLFGAIPPDMTAEERARRQRQKLSVVDAVLGDFNRLYNSRRIASNDKERLDSHVTFIRDLVRRLQASSLGEAGTCTPPARPPSTDFKTTRGLNFSQHLTDHIDVMVAAIRCGLTQVATFHMQDRGVGHSTTHDGDPASCETLAENARFLHRKVAELATKLDVVEDPATGKTYLDSTLVFAGHEMTGCDGDRGPNGEYLGMNHTWFDSPVLFLGGTNYLNTGRFVDYRQSGTQINTFYPFAQRGRPYNELLVTILQAFGLTPAEYEQVPGVAGFGKYNYKTNPEPSASYTLTDAAKRTALLSLLKG